MSRVRRIEGLLFECMHPDHVGGRMRPRGWFRRNGEGRRHSHCRECRRGADVAHAAKRRGAGVGKVPRGWIRLLWSRQVGRCALCSSVMHGRYHVDHRVAVAKGGEHTLGNLQLTHALCNLRKSSK